MTHIETYPKGVFFIGPSNERLAELTYTFAGNGRITIDSLVITFDLRDKGVEKLLVQKYVQMVRDRNLVSIPIDPLALSVFNLNPDLGDVLMPRN